MNTKVYLLATVAVLALATPAHATFLSSPMEVLPWTTVQCPPYEEVEAAHELGLDPFTHWFYDPVAGMDITVHVLCYYEELIDVEPLTDCTATGYSFTGWRWNTAENFVAQGGAGISSSTAASIFSTSGNTWDNQDAFNMFGSVTTGSGSVPVFNNQNLFRWQDLASNVIASTWTWSSSGIASESDAAYNTDFLWSTSGQSGRMDLQNIATHELGHTFGLGHSTSGTCLTMYPSGSLGETQKRTLGDGDIRGIQARY